MSFHGSNVSAAVLCLFFGATFAHEARAQASEVPGTVSKGAWLLESDLAALSLDRTRTEEHVISSRSLAVGNLLFSRGITEHMDLQAGSDGWFTESPGGGEETRHGHGDVLLRAKWNFHGTDGESLAFAVLPQLRIPAWSGDMGAIHLQPALFVPWSQPLGDAWSWGGTAGTEWVDDEGHLHAGWSLSAYLSRTLSKSWGLYVECLSAGPWGAPSRPDLQAGVGCTWQLSEKLSCECALYRGVTSISADWSPVLRLSYNF